MRRQRVDSVCMEVSSHALDQGRVDGLHWQGAMFTNLTHDHLDYHGTMENYAAAKARLFAMVPADGVVVVNDDDPWAPTMRRESRSRRTVGVGVSDDATIQIDDVRLDASGARFSLV
ncbi:Mur ligase family protein, partial [Aphanothece microscopica]|uniref:Mur ligase family protein n=1 Tax=Aphanothece microscopica TaxID=1049561 RepID=UPI003CE4CA10